MNVNEKYNFIKVMKTFTELVHPATVLINYNGKLASLRSSECFDFCRKTTSFEMWVLDDLEKKEWGRPSMFTNCLRCGSMQLQIISYTVLE